MILGGVDDIFFNKIVIKCNYFVNNALFIDIL